jgi:NitT/TauT family transport system substrate-binding protein
MRTRSAVVALVLAIAVLTGAGCQSTSTPASGPLEKTSLVVTAVPAEGETGLVVALDKGLFRKAGLHVTIKTVTSSAVVIPALINGSVDAAAGQYAPFIEADATGLAKIKIIASGFALTRNVNEIMTGPKSPITSVAGLKGKTIAVNAPNSEVSDLLYSVLAASHISPGQVHLAAIPFPGMGAALAAHRVDAAYVTEPYITEFSQEKGDVGIGDIDTGPAQNFPIAGYAVLASWARKYPNTARAFAKAIDEGNKIADSNLAELQHAFIVALHLPPNVADLMATGTFPTTPDRTQIQRVSILMQRYGQLKKPFNVTSMLTPAA